MNRDEAWALLNEYTKNPALIRHGQCVESSMRLHARLHGADEDQWGIAGLLHDFDYERWTTGPEHTREGAKILRKMGCDEEIVGAILAHVPWNLQETPRDRPIRKTLFAVDELSGFTYAVALVRPDRLEGMKAKSVVKKLKQKSFAAAVSREDIHAGAELLEMPLADLVEHCITALREIADELGLVAAEA